MQELCDAVGFQFFDDHRTVHRHQKIDENQSISREIGIADLPAISHPDGAILPKKRNGAMPPDFECPILTDFITLRDSNCLPDHFLSDVDVFTTLSAIRSLLYQWIGENGGKSRFFKKSSHFVQMDGEERLYLNTGTKFTVPFEKSPSWLNKFTILGHGQTWEEYLSTSYSGLAKIRISNGIRLAFTYKMYAQSDGQPIDIVVRSAVSFQRDIDFHFLNCFLTKKKIRRYELHRNQSIFCEEVSSVDLFNLLSPSIHSKIIDCFKRRLPDFLFSIANQIYRLDTVYSIQSVSGRGYRLILRDCDADETLY